MIELSCYMRRKRKCLRFSLADRDTQGSRTEQVTMRRRERRGEEGKEQETGGERGDVREEREGRKEKGGACSLRVL